MAIEMDDDFLAAVPLEMEQRVDLRLQPVVIFMAARGSEIKEIGEADDLPEELQKLRLPVLKCVAQHLR